MLITITNSNSSPEVNSSEVSLKSQCEFCVCTQKYSNHLLGEIWSLRDLCTCAHMYLYTNSFLSRIRILKTNYNHHCNDHSNYEFSLVCIGPFILKTNCNHHYNDSSYKFSLVFNRSMSVKKSKAQIRMLQCI